MKKTILAAVVLLGCTFASCKKNNAITGDAATAGKQSISTAASSCQGKPAKFCICPDVYRPVCGCNGVTYGNSCEASCAGILIYTNGPCGGGGEEL